MTLWVWWLVCSTTERTLSSGPVFSRSRRARSISAWAWYSAECSLVYVSRIARRASPGSGSRTV